MTTIDSITGMFPHPTILQTHAPNMEPTYDSLHAAITQLNANAASVPTSGGDGILGHLVLTLGAAGYTAISINNVPHDPPVPPPAIPVIPGNATAALISELRTQHNDEKRHYKTYYAVDAALKQQLLQATDERFVVSLKHRTYGFALVRTRTIIAHLYTTYGTITSEELTQNDELMRVPWEPTTPIEGLFEQIDDGSAYAISGGDPYTDKQLVRFGYNNIDSNGRMSLACRDWRQKPEIDRTWANFKTDFKRAHLDLRLQTTSGSAGFQGHANHAATDDDDSTAGNQADATNAHLANLAEAQIANNAQVTTLTDTITQLQLQLHAATTAIATLQGTRRNNPQRDRRGAAPGGDAPAAAQRYCWTHGGRVASTHTSQTCTNPAEGHQRQATFADRRGGSNRFCRDAAP